jgi:hypothetical protein
MSKGLFALLLMSVPGTAVFAQSFDAPTLKAGDSWTYSNTTETGPQGWVRKDQVITVERVDSSDVLVAVKQDGSSQPPIEQMTGLDWSRSRDINGKQQVVNRPFEFPLHQGKKWTVEYTELNPNRTYSSETFHSDYVVTGWEDVEVPAGKFKALKIEAEGQWTGVLTPKVASGTAALGTPGAVTMVSQVNRSGARSVSGKLYKAFWYVPSEKRFVKSVEEYYSDEGVRSQRFTDELASSKLSS